VQNRLFFVTGALLPFASHMCKMLGTLRPLFERHGALTRTQFNLVLSVGVWPSILQPFTQHVFMDPHAVGACVLSIIALIGHTAFALSFISGTADAGSAPSRFLGAVLSRALFGFAQGGLTIAQNTLCVFFCLFEYSSLCVAALGLMRATALRNGPESDTGFEAIWRTPPALRNRFGSSLVS